MAIACLNVFIRLYTIENLLLKKEEFKITNITINYNNNILILALEYIKNIKLLHYWAGE